MQRSIISVTLTASWLALGCASYPAPTQHLADAQSAERSAVELGAPNEPKAQLHLALAREQIGQATVAMKDGDNERADALLLRARSDAELAIALTRDKSAKTEARKAVDQSNTQRSTNLNQGAVQ
jgi:PBP1b-binding outer membrane lipoprotein LpoB